MTAMGFSHDDRFVRGDLFNQNGKWKYTVTLDCRDADAEVPSWDLWAAARRALAQATGLGISGVTLSRIPQGWTLVVLEPYGMYGHPIIVTSAP